MFHGVISVIRQFPGHMNLIHVQVYIIRNPAQSRTHLYGSHGVHPLPVDILLQKHGQASHTPEVSWCGKLNKIMASLKLQIKLHWFNLVNCIYKIAFQCTHNIYLSTCILYNTFINRINGTDKKSFATNVVFKWSIMESIWYSTNCWFPAICH